MLISADDYFKLKINGTLVGMGPAPAYTFCYNYNNFDITPYVIPNRQNEIEITVYYQGLINRVWVSGDGNQGVIADVYCDDNVILSTDESWLYTVDKTFVGTQKVGYDTAFLEDRNMLFFDNQPKAPAIKECIYNFCDEPFTNIDFYTVKPKHSNNFFYDFEQEYVATLNLVLDSEAEGEKVTVLYGEELDENSCVRYQLRCNCQYKEDLILKKGKNVIEQFDYKAFRYVQLVLSDKVKVADINICVRHFPYPDDSFDLQTDDQKLKAVFNLCKNTIKYGCQETLVDCPTREKGQYIGDVMISGFAHYLLTKNAKLLKKAILNIAQSYEYTNGEVLSVSPCAHKQKIADYSLQFPLILWRYYQHTGDEDLLKALLPLCDKINQHFAKYKDADGLLSQVSGEWNLVDWPEGARDNYDFSLTDPIGKGRHNVVNAFYLGSVLYTQKIKTHLGIDFEDEFTQLKSAFNKVFFNEKTGLYTDSEATLHSSLHSNCLPVFFDICQDENIKGIADFLVERGMACSVYMSFFYLKSLCKLGLKDIAYNLIISDSDHSWLNMIKEGATTTFEAWGKDQKHNTSLFHPWATTPIIIIMEDLK